MIISVALSRGVLTCLTDRRLILSLPACMLHFFNTGCVTDPQTDHKPANGVVMQTTARNGYNCCCFFVVIDWQSAYKAALAAYTVFTQRMTRGFTGSTNRVAAWKIKRWYAVGCCICHLRLSRSVPFRFLLDTIYVWGQIKNQPQKIKKHK